MPNTCLVTGNVKTIFGEAVEGCTIRASILKPFFHGEEWISGEVCSDETDENGDFELEVIETETVGKRMAFTFEYDDGSNGTKRVAYNVVVPDEADALLSDLVAQNNIPNAGSTIPAQYVTVQPVGNLESEETQAALEELQGDIDNLSIGVGLVPSGELGDPLEIDGAVGIVSDNDVQRQLQFIKGLAGAVTNTANPRISPGTSVGQELVLTGCSDTDTVTIPDGQGVKQNGDVVLKNGDVIAYFWDSADWKEMYRSR